MTVTIKWQSDDGTWNDFDTTEINGYPVTHALDLFSFRVPVVAKQDDMYFVNTPDLKRKYQSSGKKVTLLQDIKRSDKSFGQVGFSP